MKGFFSKLLSAVCAAAIAVSVFPAVPSASAAVSSLEEYDVEITEDGQVVDSFRGVDARYATYYSWSESIPVRLISTISMRSISE